MADRTIKPDDTNDLVLQNNDGSAKLELNEDQTVKVTTGSDAGEDFTVNTSQLVVEGDTANVGIGASPDTKLNIVQSSTGRSWSPTGGQGDLIVERNGNAGVSIVGANGSTSNLNFGDTDDEDAGFISYDHNNNSMSLRTNSAGTDLTIDSSGNVGIGTSSIDQKLVVQTADGGGIAIENSAGNQYRWAVNGDDSFAVIDSGTAERLRIDSSGNVAIKKQVGDDTVEGTFISGRINQTTANGPTMLLNRHSSDGDLILFRQANITEGTISVSGSTVSYNGGHLSRWSQLPDNSRDNSLLKGTVMTNLDQMAVWTHDAIEAVEAQDAVFDEEGNLVTEAVQAVEAQDAYTEDNEQLNCMAISTVEGDPNVAGVFVNWDEDDDYFHNDMNIAMTGDMVIRIAQGVTVEKGQLLMSAGDGTAKPQGDDIVRNKTIAKVTSNHVSHTYDDGSFCVPCVLMAC